MNFFVPGEDEFGLAIYAAVFRRSGNLLLLHRHGSPIRNVRGGHGSRALKVIRAAFSRAGESEVVQVIPVPWPLCPFAPLSLSRCAFSVPS